MPSPLNPVLYRRLREEFGSVNIAHEGAAATKTYTSGIFDNKPRLNIISAGEYYCVPCLHCNDTRNRLWVNHLWGVEDEVTKSKNLWLAICFNENCLAAPNRPQELYDRIYGFKNYSLRNQKIEILKGETEEQVLKEVTLPGICSTLDQLPPSHTANTYLRERGYDTTRLGNTFDISYCLSASSNYPMADGRIVIPIYMHKQLIGWQCRHVGDLNWKAARIPKYYSRPNMPKRLMLYNYDNAIKSDFVVLVEGPMDTWNLPSCAVATLGKKPSTQQLELICQTWMGGAVVIMLDGDAHEDTDHITNILKESFKGQIVPIKLPSHLDPGELSEEYLWDIILSSSDRLNVDLSSVKRTTHAVSKNDTAYGPFGSGADPRRRMAV